MLPTPLYHSTNFTSLMSITRDGLIMPGALTPDDRSHVNLKTLNDRNLRFAWFSTQIWSSSNFGAYVFKIDGNALLKSELLPLGIKHQGARCYITAPPMLMNMIAMTLGIKPIDPATDHSWRRKSNDDRVDILVPWPVPAGQAITFVSSTKADDVRCDHSSRFARARFMAKMLQSNCHDFDAALSDVDAVGEDMLVALLGGTATAFARRAAAAKANQKPLGTNHFTEAMTELINGDVSGACDAAAYLGSERDVADEVASALSAHFGQTVSGAVLYDKLP